MRYISFENDGALDLWNLMLMGASTKRGDKSKIGQYGSGWKYALATLLREDIPISIYSGGKSIQIGMRSVTMGTEDFNMVTVDGKDTNFTTDLGPDWKVWMAIREIYCNSLDEPHSAVNQHQSLPPLSIIDKTRTRIIIGITPEVQAIIDNWMDYFSFERTDDVIALPGVKVFEKLHKQKSIIYRKGIKVAESSKPGVFDYDFEDVDINEIREAKDFYQVESLLKNAMTARLDADVIYRILSSEGTWEKDIDFHFWDRLDKASWGAAIGQRVVVPMEFSDQLTDGTEASDTILRVPANLAKLIADDLPDITVLGYPGKSAQLIIPVAETTEHKAIIDAALQVLGMYKSRIIRFVKFNNSKTLSSHTDEEILLAERLATNGQQGQVAIEIFKQVTYKENKLQPVTLETENYLFEMVYRSYINRYDQVEGYQTTQRSEGGY